MKFKYSGYDKSRKKITGVAEYEDRQDAVTQLKALDYRITKLEIVKENKIVELSNTVSSSVRGTVDSKFGGKKRIKQFNSFKEELDFMGFDTTTELRNIIPSDFDVNKYKDTYDLSDIQIEKILSGRLNSKALVTGEIGKASKLAALNPFGRITLKDLIMFTEHLSILLATNVILIDALETIQEDMQNAKFKRVIDMILYDLNKGMEFSTALEAHPTIFTPLYISMVRVGETTGSELPNTLNDLVTFLQMNLRLQRQFILAMIYPISVLLVLVGLLTVVSKFVMPRLMTLFDGERFELPKFTSYVFMVAENIGYIFLVGFIILVVAAVLIIRVSAIRVAATKFMDVVSLRIPVLNKMVITRFMYQISLTLSITLRSGISITDALNLVHNIIGNSQLKGDINSIYYGLEKGRSIADVFREQPHLENLLKQAVAAGDKSGMLGETLGKIAKYYDGELTNRIDTLIQVLVPATIVVLALLVAPFIIGIYLPIASLTQQVSKM